MGMCRWPTATAALSAFLTEWSQTINLQRQRSTSVTVIICYTITIPYPLSLAGLPNILPVAGELGYGRRE